MTREPATSDVRAADLTSQQAVAGASTEKRLFIDAGPGTGKTTVAAQRFGVLRFAPEARTDHRAVTAVSFTRAATWNLQRRVKRIWGPASLGWPHRIVTLDTIMNDLLRDLLDSGLLRWPTGHTELTVVDSWTAFGRAEWTDESYEVVVDSGEIKFVGVLRHKASRVLLEVIDSRLEEGICTHQDVRDALDAALEDVDIAERVRARLAETTRALIVDEVFDANDLDLKIIELAVQADLSITLVGDPWQALYVFRGARPEAIPELLDRTGTRTLALTQSFRWGYPSQRKLAEDLRAGHGVILDTIGQAIAANDVDVVLALMWKQLWTTSDQILPLAFQSFKGGAEEAAATLLLNHMTSTVLGQPAAYLADALLALAIKDPAIPDQLHGELQRVLDLLASGTASVKSAYAELAEIIKDVSPRPLRRAHPAHTGRLAALATRLARDDQPVLGLTTHQAKGGEWDTVGVALSETEHARLHTGLLHTEEIDRMLYVACTRARRRTVLVGA